MSKINNFKNKCRTCLNGSKGLQLLTKVISEKNEQSRSYGELLKYLTHIDVMSEAFHEMPQSMCGRCIRKLKDAYAFVQQAQEVNDKLWSMVSGKDSGIENKPIDCLQEAQIDIQNCLEIKIEDDETSENNRQNVTHFEVELKLEAPEEVNVDKNTNTAKYGTNGKKDETEEEITFKDVLQYTTCKPTESMSECEEDCDLDDIFDKNDQKLNAGSSDSDAGSVSSNDSDWAKQTYPMNAKDNQMKSKTPVRSKKIKDNIDENIPTPCDQCDRVFPNSRLLSRHKRHTHVPEELKVQCPYCPAKFGRRHNMYAHMRTHHKDKNIEEHITQQRKFPRQYACEQCDGTYTSKYYLLAHMKIKHNPDGVSKKPERVILPKKRFLCTLCGSKFDTQSNLDVHIRRHTGEKPYKCDLCDRSFYRPCDVQAHRRSHTGEKPFKCTLCGKAFARSNKLKIHMRTHSNERPYKCEQCEKAFKHSKDLNIHKRIHTGERPYTCGVCHSTFTQSNSLKLHQTKQQHFEIIDQVMSS